MLTLLIWAGKKIYVHCKAGASRSASVVAAYDARFNNKLLEDSINDLKRMRTQVDIGAGKKATFEEILSLIKTEEIMLSEPANSPYGLASLEGKNKLRQLPCFKKLALYAAAFDGSNRATCIKTLFSTIYLSTDDKWRLKLNSEGCPLKKFADANPHVDAHLGFDDKSYRVKLANDFALEVDGLAKSLL